MNLTLTLDDQTAQEARQVASAMGKSLEQLVQDYLERLTGHGNLEDDIAEFERLSSPPRGDSKGWKFNREEIYERSQLL
jgi:hypothetical protein